jgi:hypothetical protein
MSTVLLKTITRNVPCHLSDMELLTRADELSVVVQEITAEEGRQVDVKAQMKARLTELDARKSRLAITIGRKEEYRDVPCDLFANVERGIVEVVRRDTAEVVESRAMSDDERQKALPLEVAS